MGGVKKFTFKVVKNPFFSGSFIMIVGSNISNVFAYLYHIVFGRLLSVSEYGNLAAFLSILGILGMLLSFLGLIIVKYISSIEENKIYSMSQWFLKKTFYFSVCVGLIILILNNFLSSSLKLSDGLILLAIPTYIISNLVYVYNSFMQGAMNFKTIVLANNANMFLRIVFGFLLVYFGFSTFGAAAGVTLSSLITLLIYYSVFRKYARNKIVDFVKPKGIIKYSIPVFITMLASTLLLNLDLLLVKYFFDSETAGLYAAVSILGKIVFYATSPIGSVMFPIISRRFSNSQNYLIIFWLSILLSMSSGLFISAIYFFTPQLAILPLYGIKYIDASKYIGIYAIFITLFSISSLFINLYQSTNRPKVGYLLLLSALSQVVLIYFNHQNLLSVIYNLIIVMFATLSALVIYYFKDIYKLNEAK